MPRMRLFLYRGVRGLTLVVRAESPEEADRIVYDSLHTTAAEVEAGRGLSPLRAPADFRTELSPAGAAGVVAEYTD
jgi:hypothetical protein